MLKKFTILILLALYSFSSSGISVNLFYCCGELKNVSIESHAREAEKCGMNGIHKGGKKCCEEKTLQAEISENQRNNSFETVSLPDLTNFVSTPPALFSLYNNYKEPKASEKWVPDPPLLLTDRSVLYSVFII